MDSDKVIVMDGGQAVEFDHPHELLQLPSSYFSHMVNETGPDLEKKLRKVAEDDYNMKYSGITVNNDEQKSLTKNDTNNEDQENVTNTEANNK